MNHIPGFILGWLVADLWRIGIGWEPLRGFNFTWWAWCQFTTHQKNERTRD